jgi:phosphoglycolate phosphatase
MTDPAGPVQLEIISSDRSRGPFRCAVFDFDGTLSLLRGNWQGLMVPMMIEMLSATGSGESHEALTAIVKEFVTRLTGQPTIVQMRALAAEVAKRGRPPPDPREPLALYLDRLLARTERRIAGVQSGGIDVETLLVRGTRRLLEFLEERGWLLAIASGTELAHVVRESQVLRIDRYFGPRIFGPVENDAGFTKEAVLRQLMAEHGLPGRQIVVIGDGPAEMLAAKAVGALALGVASDEVHRDGRINQLKREHLLRAGADVIVADYGPLASLVEILGCEPPSSL